MSERTFLVNYKSRSLLIFPFHYSEEGDKWYQTAFNWICGIEKMRELTPEEEEQMEKENEENLSLAEDPIWRKACNVNAVILMAAGVFIWAFFN